VKFETSNNILVNGKNIKTSRKQYIKFLFSFIDGYFGPRNEQKMEPKMEPKLKS
jgi:hypothetical protein